MCTQKTDDSFNSLDTIYRSKAVDHSLFDQQKLSTLRKQRKTQANDNYYELILADLERFIEALLGCDEAPFLFDSQDRHYKPASPIADYFSSVPDFVRVVGALSDRYEYSEHINVFIICARSLGLLDTELEWKNEYLDAHKIDPRFSGKPAAILFNELVGAGVDSL